MTIDASMVWSFLAGFLLCAGLRAVYWCGTMDERREWTKRLPKEV